MRCLDWWPRTVMHTHRTVLRPGEAETSKGGFLGRALKLSGAQVSSGVANPSRAELVAPASKVAPGQAPGSCMEPPPEKPPVLEFLSDFSLCVGRLASEIVDHDRQVPYHYRGVAIHLRFVTQIIRFEVALRKCRVRRPDPEYVNQCPMPRRAESKAAPSRRR
jgi:hypothetical protein